MPALLVVVCGPFLWLPGCCYPSSTRIQQNCYASLVRVVHAPVWQLLFLILVLVTPQPSPFRLERCHFVLWVSWIIQAMGRSFSGVRRHADIHRRLLSSLKPRTFCISILLSSSHLLLLFRLVPPVAPPVSCISRP
jgi:hypothetical protein